LKRNVWQEICWNNTFFKLVLCPLPAYVVGWRYFVVCVLGWFFCSVAGAFVGCVFLRLFSTLCVSLRLFASSIDSFDLIGSFRITTAKTYRERKNLETEPVGNQMFYVLYVFS